MKNCRLQIADCRLQNSAPLSKGRRRVFHSSIFKLQSAIPLLLLAFTICSTVDAAPVHSITDRTLEWPSVSEVIHVLALRDYNTRLVVVSTAVLGFAGGLIGTFLLLRKRSLIGDALSHATLPGIAIAFMVMAAAGGSGKWLPGLLLGAAISGLLGVGAVMFIRSMTRLKDDTAMGIVLSVFFGFGAALLGLIQNMPQGSAAGLESFIYGKTASMVLNDFKLIAVAAAAVAAASVLLLKEFTILCFDEGYAKSQGWPALALDLLLLMLVTAVTVIGLQAVGLILVIAMLIIPPAAARFWSENLVRLMFISAAIGAFCGWLGGSISALTPRMPAGAIIVVVSAIIFTISMIFGTSRGVLLRLVHHLKLSRRIRRQHLLRAVFEITENGQDRVVRFDQLMTMRSWSAASLRRVLREGLREGWLTPAGQDQFAVTPLGVQESARVARNHRLWEIYLVTHADIAPSHVDRDADLIEHVLPPDLIERLEQLLAEQTAGAAVPRSLHG